MKLNTPEETYRIGHDGPLYRVDIMLFDYTVDEHGQRHDTDCEYYEHDGDLHPYEAIFTSLGEASRHARSFAPSQAKEALETADNRGFSGLAVQVEELLPDEDGNYDLAEPVETYDWLGGHALHHRLFVHQPTNVRPSIEASLEPDPDDETLEQLSVTTPEGTDVYRRLRLGNPYGTPHAWSVDIDYVPDGGRPVPVGTANGYGGEPLAHVIAQTVIVGYDLALEKVSGQLMFPVDHAHPHANRPNDLYNPTTGEYITIEPEPKDRPDKGDKYSLWLFDLGKPEELWQAAVAANDGFISEATPQEVLMTYLTDYFDAEAYSHAQVVSAHTHLQDPTPDGFASLARWLLAQPDWQPAEYETMLPESVLHHKTTDTLER